MHFSKIYTLREKDMENLFSTSFHQLLAVFLAAFVVYMSTILLTRISGKRSFSKMSSFDFAMTVAVGALIGTTILSPSVSLVQGIVGLSSLYLLQYVVGYFRRYSTFDFLITNRPIVLMKGRKVLDENLRKAHVTKKDLQAVLRQANVTNRDQVLAVIFETSGDVSVLHSDKENEIEQWLLEGIDE